jgi:hypothetical protein
LCRKRQCLSDNVTFLAASLRHFVRHMNFEFRWVSKFDTPFLNPNLSTVNIQYNLNGSNIARYLHTSSSGTAWLLGLLRLCKTPSTGSDDQCVEALPPSSATPATCPRIQKVVKAPHLLRFTLSVLGGWPATPAPTKPCRYVWLFLPRCTDLSYLIGTPCCSGGIEPVSVREIRVWPASGYGATSGRIWIGGRRSRRTKDE